MCCCFGSNLKPRKILFVGPEYSGKSSIIQVLMRKGLDDVRPTQSLQVRSLETSHPKCAYEFYDLGGWDVDTWPLFYSEVDFVVFVVDAAADYRHFEFTQEQLFQVQSHPDLAQKEILVFANKIDQIRPNRVASLCEYLGLEDLEQVYLKCGSALTLDGVEGILGWVDLMSGFGAMAQSRRS